MKFPESVTIRRTRECWYCAASGRRGGEPCVMCEGAGSRPQSGDVEILVGDKTSGPLGLDEAWWMLGAMFFGKAPQLKSREEIRRERESWLTPLGYRASKGETRTLPPQSVSGDAK